MKNKHIPSIACLALSLILAIGAGESRAQLVEAALAGKSASMIMSDIESRIQNLIKSAGEEGRHLIQQGAMEILIALQTLDVILEDQQDRAWKELDVSVQNSIRQISTEIDSLKEGLLEIEDFVYLDATEIMNRVPLLRERQPLRRISGSSQMFKSKGDYTFRLLGTAFDLDSEVSIELGKSSVPKDAVRSVRENELIFSVPTTAINDEFRPGEITTLPLSVSVYQRNRRYLSRLWHWDEPFELVETWSYKLPVRLLPKTAASYTLVEHQQAKIAGQPRWSSWGPKVHLSKIGKNCSKSSSCAKRANACVQIPKDSEVAASAKGVPIVRRNEGGKCDDWCGWVGEPWQETGKVCQEWRNWRKSHGGYAQIRVQYRPLSDGVEQQERKLLAVGGEESAVADLEFGKLYHSIFSDRYASFDLVIAFFNGEKVVLTPKKSTKGEAGIVSFSLEKMAGGSFRLLLSLKA